MKFFARIFAIIAVYTLLGTSCDSDVVTVDFSNTSQSSGPSIITDLEYPEWTEILPDIHLKQQLVTVGNGTELLSIVRFDPATTPFKIAVSEGNPKTLDQWKTELGASVVINASYFDESYNLTTRTVVDGESFGPLLTGKTGILRSVDGQQWTISKTADVQKNTTPTFSVQSYPLLIHNGAVNFTEGSGDTGQRTVVAMDTSGSMYWIIAEYGVTSLNELSLLLDTDLNIDISEALNLDGGSSTGLIISETEDITYYNSAVAVPAVLYIPAVD